MILCPGSSRRTGDVEGRWWSRSAWRRAAAMSVYRSWGWTPMERFVQAGHAAGQVPDADLGGVVAEDAVPEGVALVLDVPVAVGPGGEFHGRGPRWVAGW